MTKERAEWIVNYILDRKYKKEKLHLYFHDQRKKWFWRQLDDEEADEGCWGEGHDTIEEALQPYIETFGLYGLHKIHSDVGMVERQTPGI